jgi:two-component system alkaline phosphatase synthesis response regulator PhoP
VTSAGNLVVNFDNFHVSVEDVPVFVSFQEFELLRTLLANLDRVISTDALTRAMWQETGRTYVRRLNVVVHRLRAKLAGSRPYQIESVRGRGYGLVNVA